MNDYSYRPMRLGGTNIGKVKHKTARDHLIKLYTKDQKIQQQYMDKIAAAQTQATTPDVGVAAPIVPNPGNPITPVQVTGSESKIIETPDNGAADGVSPFDVDYQFTINKQEAFHNQRAQLMMENANRHHVEMRRRSIGAELANGATRNHAQDDDLAPIAPTSNPLSMPSLFDHYAEDEHTPVRALEFHTQLHGDSIMEAQGWRAQGDKIKEDMAGMDDLGNDSSQATKMMAMTEALKVCEMMYDMHNELAEMHGYYAGDFDDYLKRRADQTFDRATKTYPQPSPDPNPFPPPHDVTLAGDGDGD